jgi:hypothetical protein
LRPCGEEEVTVPAEHVLHVETGDGDDRVYAEVVHQHVEAVCIKGGIIFGLRSIGCEQIVRAWTRAFPVRASC